MRNLPLLFTCVLLASCAATKTAPVPDVAMATRSGQNVESLQRGHAVYVAHCGRCHEHILPKDVSKEDWHVVAPGMAWNAGISKADEKALTAYLLAATR
ncbi:cytochrome c [Luteolibacter arcticus]|uniref:Cytochrome c n=1 Tax=Luteolibacter arcticus TaxID=1581411 RepID=A0ABT3GPB3_9BACT|nr:cytochrome c [Luteolibacter arcticus]MCW1925363.1 cytochrome c [Luteolibacter arcticus]